MTPKRKAEIEKAAKETWDYNGVELSSFDRGVVIEVMTKEILSQVEAQMKLDAEIAFYRCECGATIIEDCSVAQSVLSQLKEE